jgi:cellulose synthase/poly-beta-1,6-N-acetylglucosamine synthase-like glycosyltransferase
MISIIITAYKEERTIGKAIESILKNNLKDFEILVTAPDDETLNAARLFKKNKKIKTFRDQGNKSAALKLLKDQGKGKSAALNFVVSKAKGDILVLTDGDVYMGENSLKPLLAPFKDEKVGAVAGNPVALNSKKTMLGFWAYVLSSIADKRRKRSSRIKKRLFCSGYLFAVRKNLFPKLSENLLSEDGFISHSVYRKNYDISYNSEAKVYVKYPTNFKDWIIQKKRSIGGYNQIKKLIKVEIRSFKQESLGGLELFKFVSNFKELIWLLTLFLARIYLWMLIYRDINIRKKSHKEIWLRVESTK